MPKPVNAPQSPPKADGEAVLGEWVPVRIAADRAGLHVSTVEKWIAARDLPARLAYSPALHRDVRIVDLAAVLAKASPRGRQRPAEPRSGPAGSENMPKAVSDVQSPPKADGTAVMVPAGLAGLVGGLLRQWIDGHARERGARPGPALVRLMGDLEHAARSTGREGAPDPDGDLEPQGGPLRLQEIPGRFGVPLEAVLDAVDEGRLPAYFLPEDRRVARLDASRWAAHWRRRQQRRDGLPAH